MIIYNYQRKGWYKVMLVVIVVTMFSIIPAVKLEQKIKKVINIA